IAEASSCEPCFRRTIRVILEKYGHSLQRSLQPYRLSRELKTVDVNDVGKRFRHDTVGGVGRIEKGTVAPGRIGNETITYSGTNDIDVRAEALHYRNLSTRVS